MPVGELPESELQSYPELPNSRLLELAQRAAPGVERQLYERFADVVERVVWKLLGPDGEHDDIVHDTFLEIFRTIHQVREPDKLREWVAAVAVHTTRREIRRRRGRKWVPWDSGRDERIEDHWGAYEGQQLVRRVYSVLGKMPTRERIALSLRLFERASLDTIAELCDCSVSTVKRRLRRAQDRFYRLAKMDPGLALWLAEPGREPTHDPSAEDDRGTS